MAYGDSFKQFLIANNIPTEVLNISGGEPFIFLTSIAVSELLRSSCARKVNNGGLVIGNFHTEGGIHMLQPFENGFEYVGEMEGYEFLICPEVTYKHITRINELNNSLKHNEDIQPRPFRIPRQVKMVDMRKLNFQIMVMPAGTHYILNRTVTENYLELLDEMNDRRKFKSILRFFGV